MQSETSRDEIYNRLTGQWLPEIHQALKELLLTDIRRHRELLETVKTQAEKGEQLKAIRNVAEKLTGESQDNLVSVAQNTDEDLSNGWLQHIQTVTAGLPAEVILEQEEQRFTPNESDTLPVKAGKSLKERCGRLAGWQVT